MNAERYIKFLEQHCHNQLLECPCQPQEGTLFRLLFFGSGLRFPSPLALMIVWSSSAVGHLLISSSIFKPCSLIVYCCCSIGPVTLCFCYPAFMDYFFANVFACCFVFGLLFEPQLKNALGSILFSWSHSVTNICTPPDNVYFRDGLVYFRYKTKYCSDY